MNKRPSYEQARARLEEIVAKLESGGGSLADSMKLWEEGEKLAAICQEWLDGAKQKVAKARATQQPMADATETEPAE